ncbi:MAG: bifunctional phosphoribosyl-AMP cyclohydrolase/phosphoribosyl-ATP diphosphatase HisIE [Candidatus Peribacteraceae bacterium]|nr:bifunctional phosphoribosyl-AMP cyclohydrolase/phosphoribosyl-ATP diphosphatase HisIE [Candidatus Peribacteraceae bacterium]
MIDPATLNWQKSPDGLLPAIIQDSRSGTVLMLGYMNQAALESTLESGFVTFWSRSKRRLWKKGEASGNTLKIQSICADCDNDALLIRAIPAGPTCHTGKESCFMSLQSRRRVPDLRPADNAYAILDDLIETIRQRSTSKSKTSYTKQLLDGGIAAYGAKVLEEAEEVVRAARSEGKQRTIEESADLLYHLLVLLRGEGIEIDDVAEELRKRQRA